jgi:23S rRNA pseudouridine2605 synthase
MTSGPRRLYLPDGENAGGAQGGLRYGAGGRAKTGGAAGDGTARLGGGRVGGGTTQGGHRDEAQGGGAARGERAVRLGSASGEGCEGHGMGRAMRRRVRGARRGVRRGVGRGASGAARLGGRRGTRRGVRVSRHGSAGDEGAAWGGRHGVARLPARGAWAAARRCFKRQRRCRRATVV